MGDTSIQWTDKTWSPLRARVKADAGAIAEKKGYTSLVQIATKMAGHVGSHCERVSHGCDHCYSDTNNGRCLPANGTGLPFDRRSRDLVEAFIDEKILHQPLKWRKPRRVFVENQSDLFGDWVTDEMIDRVFSEMSGCQAHTFQVLTKRPQRMLAYLKRFKPDGHGWMTAGGAAFPSFAAHWPLPNVWLGVSVEDQTTAKERIPLLLQTPAAIRFVSYEPALGPVNFDVFLRGRLADEQCGFCGCPSGCGCDCNFATRKQRKLPCISWIIVGGESGPGARPFELDWARRAVWQCQEAGVACFIKQLGAKPHDLLPNWGGRVSILPPDPMYIHTLKPHPLGDRKGGDMAEWPHYLRVRQFPEARA